MRIYLSVQSQVAELCDRVVESVRLFGLFPVNSFSNQHQILQCWKRNLSDNFHSVLSLFLLKHIIICYKPSRHAAFISFFLPCKIYVLAKSYQTKTIKKIKFSQFKVKLRFFGKFYPFLCMYLISNCF